MAYKNMFLLILLIVGQCWTAFSMEQLQADGSSFSDAGDSDDSYYQGDNGFVFVNEDSDKFNDKEEKVEAVSEKPFKLVASKGDITTVPPPNTTAPSGLSQNTPVYMPPTRPTDPPEESSIYAYSTFTSTMILIVYFVFLVIACSFLAMLMFLCVALIEKNGLSLPRNLSFATRLNPLVSSPPIPIRRGGNKTCKELPKRVRANNQVKINMPCAFECGMTYRSLVEEY